MLALEGNFLSIQMRQVAISNFKISLKTSMTGDIISIFLFLVIATMSSADEKSQTLTGPQFLDRRFEILP